MVKSRSNISPDAGINYANKHENKVFFHRFKSQGFRREGVGLFSGKPSEARTMRRGGTGGGEKNAAEKYFLPLTSRPAMAESQLFPVLGSLPELRGGLVRMVDGDKKAES